MSTLAVFKANQFEIDPLKSLKNIKLDSRAQFNSRTYVLCLRFTMFDIVIQFHSVLTIQISLVLKVIKKGKNHTIQGYVA